MSEETRTTAGPERKLLIGLLVAFLAFAALLIAIWSDIREQNRTVLDEIAAAEKELAAYRQAGEFEDLPTLSAAAQRTHAELQAQWEALVARVDTFPKTTPWLSTGTNTTEEGRIDFKIALYNARTNLQARARESQRAVPKDLGMPETIAADEPAESRLLQLATVVGFMERAIDLGVPTIERIDTLPAKVHFTSQDTAVPCAREFPIRIVMQCSFGKLLEVIQALQQPGSYFALRRFYIRKPTPSSKEPLHVEVVYAGEVFDVLNLVPRVEPAPSPATPARSLPARATPDAASPAPTNGGLP
jgi:hypothetical protein